MPVAGFTRLRVKQWGKQSAIGTAVAATRRMPYRGTPSIDPTWTDPDVDTGTLDLYVAPYRGPLEATSPFEGPLAYNDIPYIFEGLKGGVSPTGTTDKTWTHALLSTTADTFGYLTEEYGDDQTTDFFQLYGGITEEVTFELPDDMTAWTASGTLRFAGVNAGTITSVPTTGLTVDQNPVWVMGGETSLYINDAAASIGTTKLTDALHGATVTISPGIDQKRYANGAGNVISGYGRSGREITFEARFAKTSATITEAAKYLNASASNRYVELKTIATANIITGIIPYSWSQRFAGRWYTREEGDIGGNSVIVLGCKAFYDTTLGYAYRSSVVNTLAAL